MSRDILLTLIDPDPEQARRHFDQAALDDLAASMAASGLAVPVLVRPGAGERFVLVHGERRWRAARQLGWQTVPADVRDVTADQARWLGLVENVQRADLSPIEEGQAYQGILSEGMTQEELGRKVGKTQSYIAHKLRLLTLPGPLKFYLDRRVISEGHARQLLRLRAFYGSDLPAPLAWPWETSDLIQAVFWQDPGHVALLLSALRPLDGLLFFPDESAVLAGGCHSLATWWKAAGGQAPQWAVAAFWWASLAAYFGFSVADLQRRLDDAESVLYSAVVWLEGRERVPADDLGWLQWNGYHSDLRHSGCLSWATQPPRRVLLDAIDHVAKADFFTAPSNCQPYAQNGARWETLATDSDGDARVSEEFDLLPL